MRRCEVELQLLTSMLLCCACLPPRLSFDTHGLDVARVSLTVRPLKSASSVQGNDHARRALHSNGKCQIRSGFLQESGLDVAVSHSADESIAQHLVQDVAELASLRQTSQNSSKIRQRFARLLASVVESKSFCNGQTLRFVVTQQLLVDLRQTGIAAVGRRCQILQKLVGFATDLQQQQRHPHVFAHAVHRTVEAEAFQKAVPVLLGWIEGVQVAQITGRIGTSQRQCNVIAVLSHFSTHVLSTPTPKSKAS